MSSVTTSHTFQDTNKMKLQHEHVSRLYLVLSTKIRRENYFRYKSYKEKAQEKLSLKSYKFLINATLTEVVQRTNVRGKATDL